MAEHVRTIDIDPVDTCLRGLASEARAEGYMFIDRFLTDAVSGANRFDKPGEVFCGAFLEDHLVGCGGLNVDPYADLDMGRLRHLYVSREARRQGIAAALVQHLLRRGRSRFRVIRLRTPDARASRFYEAMGFSRTSEEAATHVIRT